MYRLFILSVLISCSSNTIEIPRGGIPKKEGQASHSKFKTRGEIEAEILRLINLERRNVGSPALANNDRLAMAAFNHSMEMVKLNYFEHESPIPENKTMVERMHSIGVVHFGRAGENLAVGPWTGDWVISEFISLWMQSRGHRLNILDRGFRYSGVGIFWSNGQIYVTQLFAVVVGTK